MRIIYSPTLGPSKSLKTTKYHIEVFELFESVEESRLSRAKLMGLFPLDVFELKRCYDNMLVTSDRTCQPAFIASNV